MVGNFIEVIEVTKKIVDSPLGKRVLDGTYDSILNIKAEKFDEPLKMRDVSFENTIESSNKAETSRKQDSKEGLTDDIKTKDDEIVEEDMKEKEGGSYREVFKEGEGDKYEVHHMPADSTSDLERNDGPSIRMEKEDHRQTASCGNSIEAREYRAAQKELIEQGKFREAIQMDIDDIREKFGDKYDNAIEEMLEYVDKLGEEGKVNG